MVDSSPSVFWNNSPPGFEQITMRFYTLQRVNGTGPSGREEGGGPHRHGIEDSDKIKKNSVVRWLAKNSKEPPRRKPPVVSVCIVFLLCCISGGRSLRGVFRHASSRTTRVVLNTFFLLSALFLFNVPLILFDHQKRCRRSKNSHSSFLFSAQAPSVCCLPDQRHSSNIILVHYNQNVRY